MITYDHRIDKILCQIEYGDHALLIYSDLNAFRQIYTRFCKMSLEERNETVLILTYYDAIGSIASIIMNAADIDVERYRRKGHLIIVDSVKEFFGSGKDFRSLIQFIERSILNNGRTGISIIADMNSFYHVGKMNELLDYERSIQAHTPHIKYTMLCCYHKVTFTNFEQLQKQMIMKQHYKQFETG
jgi:hypothetical protein